MGTWGAGILDDDFARDVYDRYVQEHGTGADGEAIVRTLAAEFAGSVADPDEGPLFWLAIAQAQWECSRVAPAVQAHVDEIVDRGLGLERWTEAGPRPLAQRQAALARFVAKLRKPRSRPAPKTRPGAAAVPFTVGDCLGIDLGDGLHGAGVITKFSPGASSSHILSIVNYKRATPPAASLFDPPSWLQVTSTPEITIVKYCVYATGYRRHRARYTVVCHVALGEVPPPLTLGIANWGNVWTDIGRRVDDPTRLL